MAAAVSFRRLHAPAFRAGGSVGTFRTRALSSSSAAADKPPARHANFAIAFDIDGVLLRGKTPIPGAVQALELLGQERVPYVLMTNGGGSLEKHKAEAVSHALGLAVGADQVILSHTPMKALAPKYKDQLVLFSGRKHVRDIATSYGFNNFLSVAELHAQHPAMYPDIASELAGSHHHHGRRLEHGERIAAVMAFMDPHHWERDAQILCDVLRSDGSLYHVLEPHQPQAVNLYLSCPDLVYSADAPTPRFGSGAFHVVLRALFRELSGRDLKYTMFGKPHTDTYRFAEAALEGMVGPGNPIQRVYGIGDNPETDIAGANAAGGHWRSVLVKTGIFRNPGNCTRHPAHVVCQDVRQAVDEILEAEARKPPV